MPNKIIENYYPLNDVILAVSGIEIDKERPDEMNVKVHNLKENKTEDYFIKSEKHINAILDVLNGKASPYEKYKDTANEATQNKYSFTKTS